MAESSSSQFSQIVSVPPLAAMPALALLRWHETGRCVPPARSDVLEWSGDDLVAWLHLPHRAVIQCGDGWCEARLASDGVLHLPEHTGPVPDQHRALLDVLARGAAAHVRAWPWDLQDRRTWRDALEPHAGALAVLAALRRWQGVLVLPSQVWPALRWGAGPGEPLPPDDAGPAPRARPAYLGRRDPRPAEMSQIRDRVHKSELQRAACALCWTYGVHAYRADLCASCLSLLCDGWVADPEAAAISASVLARGLPSLAAVAHGEGSGDETRSGLERLRFARRHDAGLAPLLPSWEEKTWGGGGSPPMPHPATCGRCDTELTEPPVPQRLVTLEEAAARLGVSVPRTSRWWDGVLFWECPRCGARMRRWDRTNPLSRLATPYLREKR